MGCEKLYNVRKKNSFVMFIDDNDWLVLHLTQNSSGPHKISRHWRTGDETVSLETQKLRFFMTEQPSHIKSFIILLTTKCNVYNSYMHLSLFNVSLFKNMFSIYMGWFVMGKLTTAFTFNYQK